MTNDRASTHLREIVDYQRLRSEFGEHLLTLTFDCLRCQRLHFRITYVGDDFIETGRTLSTVNGSIGGKKSHFHFRCSSVPSDCVRITFDNIRRISGNYELFSTVFRFCSVHFRKCRFGDHSRFFRFGPKF